VPDASVAGRVKDAGEPGREERPLQILRAMPDAREETQDLCRTPFAVFPLAMCPVHALLVLTELLGRRVSKPQALALFTVLLWASLLFLGSRMPMTGFPQRFGRDVTILRSLGAPRPSSSRPWWCS
jgi:hypothetical protein